MVDKLYVMFHTLNFQKYDRQKAKYYYEKEKGLTDKLFQEFKHSTLAESFLEDDKDFRAWFDIHKEEFKLESPIVTVNNFNYGKDVNPDDKMAVYNNAKSQTKEQRDSLMIDLMWSVLTNSDTLGQFLNPGGFESQKKTARIVTIANSLSLDEFRNRFGNIDNLKKLSLEELDSIVGSIKPKLNPLTPTTWVTLHQRNMSGAALIGIAANHNASQAIMQRTELGVSKNYSLRFNGFTYDSLHNILNNEGEYITRNVSGFLAAFVDNAKDPIAGDMNFNVNTADIAFALLRLGIPVTTVGLVISQPIVKEIVGMVNNENISIQEAINKAINKYKNLSNGESVQIRPTQKGINNYNFTDEELINNILSSHNPSNNSSNIEEVTYYSNQLKVAYMFSTLNKLASSLADLTQATRADTQNGAAGPSIADDIMKIEKVGDVLEASASPDYPLTGIDFIDFGLTEEQIINSKLPILQSFFTYGIESTENLFGRLFPQYRNSYQKIISILRDESKFNRLNVKTRNNIYNDIISYYITQFSDFGGTHIVKRKNEKGEITDTEISARDYYINEFPKEFKQFKEEHPELSAYPFINRLKVISKTKYNPVPSIIFTNVGKVTDIQKEQYIRDWTTLLYINNETKEIARKLFIYNCFKGFGFSPSGFSHLASAIIKMDNSSYLRTLNEVSSKDFNWRSFIDQYLLNHLDNRQLVPDISKANGDFILEDGTKGKISSDTNQISIHLDINSSYDLKQAAHPFNKRDEIIFHRYIHLNIKGRDIYFNLIDDDSFGNAVYTKVRPLGLKNQYVEYEYGVDSEAMESVIGESEDSDIYNPYFEESSELPEPPAGFLNNINYQKSLAESLGFDMPSTDEMDEQIAKFNSISPDIRDSLTGEEFCGVTL